MIQEFGKNGYKFRLIDFTDDLCLYEQSKDEEVYGYEIQIIKRNDTTKKRVVFGKLKETPEITLCSNEEFGTYAWAYQNKRCAKEKLQELMSEGRTKRGKKE